MPIYEYQCLLCGHQLEAWQSMKDEPLTNCPECHHSGLQKLISAAGFQLKGTGWYKTDYSAKGKARTTKESENQPTNSTEKKATEDGKKESTASGTTSADSSKDGTKSS